MACTACLVCFISTVMATATKKRKKEEAYPWKASTSSGHTTNLKQSILRLSISMQATYRFSFVTHWPLSAAAFGLKHRYLI